MTISTSEFQKYISTDISSGSYAAPAVVLADLSTLARYVSMENRRQATLRAILTNADGEAGSINVYAIHRHWDRFTNPYGQHFELRALGELAVTAGSLQGAGGAVPSTYFFADTMVWTPTDYFGQLEAAFEASAEVFSPADNSIAEISFTDLGNPFGLFLDMKVGTAASINALLKTDT